MSHQVGRRVARGRLPCKQRTDHEVHIQAAQWRGANPRCTCITQAKTECFYLRSAWLSSTFVCFFVCSVLSGASACTQPWLRLHASGIRSVLVAAKGGEMPRQWRSAATPAGRSYPSVCCCAHWHMPDLALAPLRRHGDGCFSMAKYTIKDDSDDVQVPGYRGLHT